MRYTKLTTLSDSFGDNIIEEQLKKYKDKSYRKYMYESIQDTLQPTDLDDIDYILN